jgi:predicted membrane-bound mannosyltransferase
MLFFGTASRSKMTALTATVVVKIAAIVLRSDEDGTGSVAAEESHNVRTLAASKSTETIKYALRMRDGRTVRICSAYESIGKRAYATRVMTAVGIDELVLIAEADERDQRMTRVRLNAS